MASPWVLRLKHIDISKTPINTREVVINGEVSFGRFGDNSESNVHIPSKYLSRKKPHCKLLPTQESLHLLALEGLNDTYINRRAVEHEINYVLHPGDEIGLGIARAENLDAFIYVVTKVVPAVIENGEEVVVVSDSEEDVKPVLPLLIPTTTPKKFPPIPIPPPIPPSNNIFPSTSTYSNPIAIKSESASGSSSEQCVPNIVVPVSIETKLPGGLLGEDAEVVGKARVGSDVKQEKVCAQDLPVFPSIPVPSVVSETEKSRSKKVMNSLEKAKVQFSKPLNREQSKSKKNDVANKTPESPKKVGPASKQPIKQTQVPSSSGIKSFKIPKVGKTNEESIASIESSDNNSKIPSESIRMHTERDEHSSDSETEMSSKSSHKKFSRIMKYKDYSRKRRMSNEKRIHDKPNLALLMKKLKIKNCHVRITKLTQKQIDKAMYPKKYLVEAGILPPGSGKKRRNIVSSDSEDEVEETAKKKEEKTTSLLMNEKLKSAKKNLKLAEASVSTDGANVQSRDKSKEKLSSSQSSSGSSPSKKDKSGSEKSKEKTKSRSSSDKKSKSNNLDSEAKMKSKTEDTSAKKVSSEKHNSKERTKDSINDKHSGSKPSGILSDSKSKEKSKDEEKSKSSSKKKDEHKHEKSKTPNVVQPSTSKGFMQTSNGHKHEKSKTSNNVQPSTSKDFIQIPSAFIDETVRYLTEKRKSTENDESSSKKLKVDISTNTDEGYLVESDSEYNPLDNFETVYVKAEPIDVNEQPEENWDYSQYTFDDDDILILDEYPPKSASQSRQDIYDDQNSNESVKVLSQPDDLPFANEFSWYSNSQTDIKIKEEKKDLEDINEDSSWHSDDSSNIFDAKSARDMSTPKVIKVDADKLFGTTDDDYESISDCSDDGTDLKKDDKMKSLFEDVSDDGEDVIPSTSGNDIRSKSPADDLSDVSDSPSEPETGNQKLYSDIDSSPQASEEQSMSDVSSEDSNDSANLFEESSKSKSFGHKKPQLIAPLPLTIRRRGKPPGANAAKKPEKTKESSYKKKSKEPTLEVKPKSMFHEKIKKFKGEKVTGRGSRWVVETKKDDKLTLKIIKEQRKHRLRELSVNERRRSTEEPPSPEASDSAYIPDYQYDDQPISPPSPRVEAAKLSVKLTTVNRGAFLTEDIPQGTKKTVPKLVNPSPQKIVISSSSAIVFGTAESSHISAKEKVVQNLGVLPEKVPQIKSVKDRTLKKEKRKSVSEDPLLAPDKPTSACSYKVLEDKAEPESVMEVLNEAVLEAKPSKQSKEEVLEREISFKPPKIRESRVKNSESSSPKPQDKSAPRTSDVGRSRIPEVVARPNLMFKSPMKVPESAPKVQLHPTYSLPVKPASASPKKDLREPSSSASSGKIENSILRQISKYDGDNKAERRQGTRLQFDDNLFVSTYVRDNKNPMKKTEVCSGMTRHPLPEIKNLSKVEEEQSRLILSLLYWGPTWIKKQNVFKFPPPVWKRQYIAYLDTELEQMREKRVSPLEDATETTTNLPPRASGIMFPSYESYHKEWYRLMLLEIWAMLMASFNETTSTYFHADILSWEENDVFKRSKLLNVSIPLTEEMSKWVCGPPTGGDFVIVEMIPMYERQNNDKPYVTFGYIEREKMCDVLGEVNRMHPDSGKIVVTHCECRILTKYNDLSTDQKKVRIVRLPIVMNGLKYMRALFELSVSPLQDIILRPSLKNLKAPVIPNSQKLDAAHLNMLRDFMLPAPISDEQVDIVRVVTETLRSDKPSLSVIEGFAGTGKSRVLIGIAISVMVTYFLDSKLKSPRILICFPTYEALNSFTFTLDMIRKHVFKQFKRVIDCVVVGRDDKLDPRRLADDLSLTNRVARRIARARSTSHVETEELMENDENILMAAINAKKLQLLYIKNKNKYQAHELERQLDDMEEKLRYLRLGIDFDPNQNSVRERSRQEHYKKEVLQRSNIILTTFSAIATTPIMTQLFSISNYAQTPICLIDDAQHAPEIQSLMPLVCGAQKIVMAGDLTLPKDTPRSPFAGDLGLSNSLMLRIARAVSSDKSPTKALDKQKITYYKMKVQRRLPHKIVKIAEQCLEIPPMTSLSSNVRDQSKWWPRQFLIFDHDFPVANSPTLSNRNLSSDEREEMLNQEAWLANKVFFSLKLQLTEKRFAHTYNVMFLVPDESYKEYLQGHRKADTYKPDNCTSFICTLDTCSGIEASVVIICLGDEMSRFKKREFLTLAISRTKNSCFVVGHMDYFKKIPHWLEVMKKAEKHQARISVNAKVSSETLREFIFKSETPTVGSPNPSGQGEPMDIVSPNAAPNVENIDPLMGNFNIYNRFLQD